MWEQITQIMIYSLEKPDLPDRLSQGTPLYSIKGCMLQYTSVHISTYYLSILNSTKVYMHLNSTYWKLKGIIT